MKHRLLSAVCVGFVAASCAGQGSTVFDRWYVVLLDGQRVGYSHAVEIEADDRVTTSNETRLAIRRGSMALDITQQLEFIETGEGRPIRAVSTMNLGQNPVKRAFVFKDSGIEMAVTQAGQSQKINYPPIQGDWLAPAAAQRYVEQQMKAGATKIEFRTVDVSMNPVGMDVGLTVVGEENVEVLGKTVPAIVWDMSQSIMPGVVMRQYVDVEGRTLKTRISLGAGLEVQMVEADRALAQAEVEPPEIMAATLIRPDKPIARPRALRSAIFELRLLGGDSRPEIELPRSGYQRVVWGDEHTARIVVDLSAPVNPVADLPTDDDRSASTVLNHADPHVRRLVDQALGQAVAALDPGAKAERLRRFVHRYITEKDLSIGFATASEVARTAQGDCTEHAVLLAAMLRAAEIPSRTVSGLLYIDSFLGQDDVFGYHMWTQAWLAMPGGARWVDLDATLFDSPFDAAHIGLRNSSMSDQTTINDLVALAPLLGTLEVKVVDTAE